jgi:hypothetical protein
MASHPKRLESVASRRRVVEVTGSPGTGKSSVVRTLLEAGHPRLRQARLRTHASSPLLIKNLFRVARPFLYQCRAMGPRRWNRLSMMIRLETLGDLLDRVAPEEPSVVLLDQGAVYMLSILQRALPSDSRDRFDGVFRKYWEDTLEAWSCRLSCVVVLEASNELLYRRITARPTPHVVTRMTLDGACDFFERSRRSRESILSWLRAAQVGPSILRLRTDELTVAETAERILEHVERPSPGGRA